MRIRKLTTRLLATATAVLALTSFAQGAQAQTRATDPSTLDILDVLVEKGVLSRGDADAVLTEARRRTEADAGTVRVPYVPEAVRTQIRDEIRQEVVETARTEGWAQPGALPAWINRVSITGDMRVRGEQIGYGASNTPLTPDINAINADGEYFVDDVLPLRETTEDRFRTRVRARVAVDVRVNDYVDAGVRIISGNLSDPLSTNETLTGNFDKISIGLDRAYIRVRPFGDEGGFAGSNVVFGKFDNPFFSTELLFDNDLQFEGAAMQVRGSLGGGADTPQLFINAGAFPLQEWEFAGDDKYLFGGQIGGAATITAGFRLRAAAGLYEFANVQGQYNTVGQRDNDFTAPSRVQFGNAMFNIRRDNSFVNSVKFGLASEYRVLAITALAELDVTPALVASFEFEGLKNLAFDEADLLARSVDPVNFPLRSSGDTAWHGSIGIGNPEARAHEANSWRMTGTYRRLEGDSTLDLFTDSDFGLGGTDQKGFIIEGSWAPLDNLWLHAAWYSARTINLLDAVTGTTALPIDVDTFMLDLNAKF